MIVQILKTKYDAAGIENTPRFTEHVAVDVHHQISTLSILHHEARMFLYTAHITIYERMASGRVASKQKTSL